MPVRPVLVRRPLLAHLAALVVLVVCAWPILDLDGTFIADEGSYAVQVAALDRGSWDMGYAFSAEDPTGRFVPYHAASYQDAELVPYAQHPAWPSALFLATRVVGQEVGLRLLGVVSLLGLAVAAWHLGQDLGGRPAAPFAFWLAASSPVLANAWIAWAHASSACLGALLVLAARRVARTPRSSSWWLATAAAASAGGVLLRSEGLLWAGAVGLALLIIGRRHRDRLAAGIVLVSAAAALAVERLWVARLVSGSTSADLDRRGEGAGILDRLSGWSTALVDTAIVSDRARATGLVALLFMGAAVVALRDGRHRLAAGFMTTSAAVFGIRLALESVDPAPGLLAAAPLLLLAGGWIASRCRVPWLLAALGLYLLAIAATIYPDGGALQWGGRFLSPSIGLLAGAAGAFLASRVRGAEPGRTSRRWLRPAVAAAVAVQMVGALIVPDRLRRVSEEGVERVVALGPEVVVAGGTQVPRLDWRGWPARCWIAAPGGAGTAEVRDLLAVLQRSGVARVSFAGIAPDLLRAAGATVTEAPGGRSLGTLTLDAQGPTEVSAPYTCDG